MRLPYSFVLPAFILTWPGVLSQKDNTVTYYKQRDGKFVKEGTNTPLDFINEPMNYPTADTSNSSKSNIPKIRIIEVNALVQKLNGTKIGELPQGKSDQLSAAYPHNAIVMESPKIMKKSSLRPSKSIDQVLKFAQDQAGPRASHYPVNSGLILNELDMMMTTEQYYYYYEGRNLVRKNGKNRRNKRKALKYKFTYWPDGEIPYTVDNSFGRKERIQLESSMKDWMDNTCIKFVPANPNHHDVLNIKNGQGCNSFVGRIGGDQSLNLEPACREFHVMKHELGHVIGLIHEHQRPDRDDYITVARENVGQGRLKNYRKFAPGRIDTYNVGYDYTSIMHYGKTAFSKDDVSTTMITKNPSFQEIIGTASKVSFKDAKIVNEMYNCAGHCQRRPFCGDGFVNKFCQCVCPDGTKRCSRRQFQGGNNRRIIRQRVTPPRSTNQWRRQQRVTNQRVTPQRVTSQRQRQTLRSRNSRRNIVPQQNQRRNTLRRRTSNRSNDFRSLLGRTSGNLPRETPLLLRILNILSSGRQTNGLLSTRVQGRANQRQGLIPTTAQRTQTVAPQRPARPTLFEPQSPARPQTNIVRPTSPAMQPATIQVVELQPGTQQVVDPGSPAWNQEVIATSINQQVADPFPGPPSWNPGVLDPDTFRANSFQQESFNNFGNEFLTPQGGNFHMIEMLDAAIGK